MLGKNKDIIAVFVGVLLLCLLSACTANENGTDKESQEENVSSEQGFSSEGLPSQTEGSESQVAEEDKPSGMEEMYKAILLGEEDFIRIDYRLEDKSANIEKILENFFEQDIEADIPKFAIIDLDGNGKDELILWIQYGGDSVYGYQILFYEDQEVYGFELPYRAFHGLKTDGTFISSGGASDGGISRLQFSKNGYTIEDLPDTDSLADYPLNKPDVSWYDLTPENVELVFENKFSKTELLRKGL